MEIRSPMRLALGLAAMLGGLAASPSVAEESENSRLDNWHQWRGPLATGSAPHGDPPTHWGPETNIQWKVAIPGRGSASPIVWGDRVFILTAIETERPADADSEAMSTGGGSPFRWASQAGGPRADLLAQTDGGPLQAERRSEESDDGEQRRRGRGRRRGGFGRTPAPTHVYQFVVLCLDRKTGETLWQRTANETVPHEGHHSTGSFASGSPVTDGKHVYCSFGSYGIYCYDMEGNLQWKTDLGDMQTRLAFGEGTSPALYDDTLVVTWDHEGPSFIAALDAGTGEVKWKVDRDERTTWNTPLIAEFDGQVQVITNGTNRSRSYDLATGQLLWENGGQTENPIPSSLRIDDLAICMSGFRGYAAYAIPLDAKGDLTDTDQAAWQLDDGTPYVSSAALVGDRLFFTKDRSGILTCVNARTGEAIFGPKRLPGLDDIYASPVVADGRVYFTARNGNTVVIDATADQVDILAENHLDETIDASPAIVGDTMLIRGDQHLYCIAAE